MCVSFAAASDGVATMMEGRRRNWFNYPNGVKTLIFFIVLWTVSVRTRIFCFLSFLKTARQSVSYPKGVHTISTPIQNATEESECWPWMKGMPSLIANLLRHCEPRLYFLIVDYWTGRQFGKAAEDATLGWGIICGLGEVQTRENMCQPPGLCLLIVQASVAETSLLRSLFSGPHNSFVPYIFLSAEASAVCL